MFSSIESKTTKDGEITKKPVCKIQKSANVKLYSGIGCPGATYQDRDMPHSGLKPRIEVNIQSGKTQETEPPPPGDMNIDAILEREKQHNKTESWNKLDKTIKMQKLHSYAEKYGKDNSLPVKDIKLLKAFFKDCLEKNKLQKTKEVQYNKDSRDITGIPSLHFNHVSHNYTLKITDATRVSTMKSLTPLRSNDAV